MCSEYYHPRGGGVFIFTMFLLVKYVSTNNTYFRERWMKARICQLFIDNIPFADVPNDSHEAITSLAIVSVQY